MHKPLAISLLLLSCLPISGCIVPAALIVGATAGTTGSSIASDNRSLQTIKEDKDATGYTQRWLNSDPALEDHSRLSVTVFNHVALLVGQTETADLRDRAYQIVSRVHNINHIYNEVTIGDPASLSERTQDSWITTKVRTALLSQQGLHSTEIVVVTENGVVYLMGLITRHQADLAVDAARRVENVQKVMKVFEYVE